MAVQDPIVVGSTYEIAGHALLKATVSDGAGEPVRGIVPQVTIVRDRDNTAANFVTMGFETITPVSLETAPYSTDMTEVGFGTYQYEFDPIAFLSPNEEVYTAIFHYGVDPYRFTINSEFTFTDVFGAKINHFGFINRYLNVPVQTPTKIGYKAKSGSNVELTIYNPFGEVIIAAVPMTELGTTGVFLLDHVFGLQGEHILYGRDLTNHGYDAQILTVGGDSDRLKRIEDMLRSLTRSTPSVGPCGTCR